MPNYETQLQLLEHKGINYHRVIANAILEKIDELNPCVVLISGEKDFIISHLIAKGMKNRKCYLKVIYNPPNIPPMNFFHPVLKEDVGDISEYDLVISIDEKKKELSELLSAQKFMFFPRIDHILETKTQFIASVSQLCSYNNIDICEFHEAYYCDFNICFSSL